MNKKIFLFAFVLWGTLLVSTSSCKSDDDLTYSAEADSLLDVYSAKLESIMTVAGDIFMNSNSPKEASKSFGEIRSIEGVKRVYSNNNAFYVEIEGWGVLPYIYSGYDTTKGINTRKANENVVNDTRAVVGKIENGHTFNNGKKVCIINQQAGDDITKISLYVDKMYFNFESKGTSISEMCKNFEDCGFTVKPFEGAEVTKEVYSEKLFEYDLVFILTHGGIDSENRHWLLTGEEFDPVQHGWFKSLIRRLYSEDRLKEINKAELEELLELTKTKLRIAAIDEWHNGVKTIGYYLLVSEEYLESSKESFKNKNAIVYNCACHSLQGNTNLADVFLTRGAACYLGWTETDCRGSYAGKLLFNNMLNGQSVGDAYDALPDDFSRSPGDHGAFLDIVYSKTRKDGHSICITRPKRYDADVEKVSETDFKVGLKGELTLLDLDLKENDKRRVGFFTSTDKDMSIKNDHPGTRMNGGHAFTFTSTLSVDHLKPNTTYYYTSYFYDGKHYCLSDTSYFMTPEVSRIQHVVPDELLNIMSPYIPIYDGANPPVVEGTYVISPKILSYNSDPSSGYKPGKIVLDGYLIFSNQDPMTNTINYRGVEVNSSNVIKGEDNGSGAFISGEGNNFSIFFKTEGVSYYDGEEATSVKALIISGTKEANGIKDIYYAFVMLDKNDPHNHLMKKDAFRIYVDEDGFADKTTLSALSRGGYSSNSIMLPGCADEDSGTWPK